jgi:hypothetical protein
LNIQRNLEEVRKRIVDAACRAGRDPAEIKLVAVTKTVPLAGVKEVLSCGVNALGENRVQEFLAKYAHLSRGAEWHFIGRLQTNKVKKIIGKTALIHSLDRHSLAQTISKAACNSHTVARVLVQVNIAGEKTKAGLSPGEVPEFVAEAGRLPGLEVCGLMTIAPMCPDPEEVRPYFKQLCELARRLPLKFPGLKMPYLSMGMTGDFEVAVEEGANILRVGTAIFGKRY